MTSKEIAKKKELELNTQIAALEQLLAVHETTVLEQSKSLEQALEKLKHEVYFRKQVEDALIDINELLEQRVAERTLELEEVNKQLHKQINEHKQTQNSLKNALTSMEILLEGLPAGVVIIDRNKKIRKANQAALEIMGNKAEEVIGKICHQFMCPAMENRCPIIDLGYQYNNDEREVLRNNGSKIPVIKTVLPLTLEGEEVLVEVFTDISNLKEAEKERQIMEIQLRQAMKLEAIGKLAAGIAHEINTPTQYIGANIQFLQDSFEGISQLADKFNVLLDAVKKENTLSDLIEEFEELLVEIGWEYMADEIPQAISEAEEGVKKVTSIVLAMKEFSHPGGKEKKLADLNHIIETIVTVARSEWRHVSNVEMALDSDLPLVPLLTSEMGQVVLNLLVNGAHSIAVKLRDNSESDKGLISIKTSHDDGWVEGRITDSGTGIPEKIRDLIFDPFFTTKKVGKGTGQGLAIAYDIIIHKHGGTLTFETEAGKGSTFIFRIPAKA